MMKTVLKSTFFAATVLGAALLPTMADAQVYVRVGPPRPIYERPGPVPHPGWAWRGGYHRWDGARYVWVPGEYVAPPRPGVRWVPGHWNNGPRGYFWVEGHWV